MKSLFFLIFILLKRLAPTETPESSVQLVEIDFSADGATRTNYYFLPPRVFNFPCLWELPPRPGLSRIEVRGARSSWDALTHGRVSLALHAVPSLAFFSTSIWCCLLSFLSLILPFSFDCFILPCISDVPGYKKVENNMPGKKV